jgi:hypothetical protein
MASRPESQGSSATRSNTVSSQHAEHAGRCLRCRFPTILSTRRQGRTDMTPDDLRLWSRIRLGHAGQMDHDPAFVMIDPTTDQVLAECDGPDASGRCPMADRPPTSARGAPHRHRRWLRARVIHGHEDGAWALSDRRRQQASREPQDGRLEAEPMSRFAPTATARRGEI